MNCGGGLLEVNPAEAQLQQGIQTHYDAALRQETANEGISNYYMRQRLVEHVFT